jgi:hypothetical protein
MIIGNFLRINQQMHTFLLSSQYYYYYYYYYCELMTILLILLKLNYKARNGKHSKKIHTIITVHFYEPN